MITHTILKNYRSIRPAVRRSLGAPHPFSSVVTGCLLLLVTHSVCGSNTVNLVAVGDSLIAGYGLAVENGFVTQLENALRKKSYDIRVFNAGVSGDTTHGGLARIDWVLADNYSAVILHLGHNDAFRGIPVEQVRQNLDELIGRINRRSLPILLAGAMAPRNLGPDYYLAFDAIFPQLAEKYELLFYPFFLEGVATEPTLNQADGIHPNADGVALIIQQMLPHVEQLLKRAVD